MKGPRHVLQTYSGGERAVRDGDTTETLIDADVDLFAHEAGTHNGPKCVVCQRADCHHCYNLWWRSACGGDLGEVAS